MTGATEALITPFAPLAASFTSVIQHASATLKVHVGCDDSRTTGVQRALSQISIPAPSHDHYAFLNTW
jgi:hypothetical protein